MTMQRDSGSSEGTPPEPGAEGSQGNDQQNSFDMDAFVSALVEHPEFVRTLTSSVQSIKDRRFNKVENVGQRVDEFEKRFSERMARIETWVKSGKSQEEANLLARMEESLAQPAHAESDAAPPTPAGNQEGEVASDEVKAVLTNMGLNLEDPRVMGLLSRPDAPWSDFISLAVQVQTKAAQPPNPATLFQPPGGGKAATETIESITAQLEAEHLRSPLNFKKIAELDKKLAALMDNQ